jgi:hypothetical protein
MKNELERSSVLGLQGVHLFFELRDLLTILLTTRRCRLSIADTAGFLTPGLEFIACHGNAWIIARLFLDPGDVRLGIGSDRFCQRLIATVFQAKAFLSAILSFDGNRRAFQVAHRNSSLASGVSVSLGHGGPMRIVA